MAGQSLGSLNLRSRFGVAVVTIDRQGTLLRRPSAHTELFPNDRLLLLGAAANLREAANFLRSGPLHPGAPRPAAGGESLDELEVDTLAVTEPGRWAGAALRELSFLRAAGVQVVGVRRDGVETIPPPADFVFASGDEVLLMGTLAGIDAVRRQ